MEEGYTCEKRLNIENDGLETYIYVVGGRDRGKTLGVCERFCIERCEWERCAALNEPRGSHGVASTDSKIYAIGGGGMRSNLVSVEAFDSMSASWTHVSPMSVPRHALSAISSDGALFAVGGWMNGNCSSNDVERYDPSQDQWHQCSPLHFGRKLHGLTSLDGLLYTFGGAGTDESLIKSAELYSPTTDQWHRIADLPIDSYASAACCSGAIFVFLWGKYVARYDIAANRYQRLGALPLPEWFGFCATTVGDEIYVMGGQTKGRRAGIAYRYCPATDEWHTLPAMRVVRRRCAAAVLRHAPSPPTAAGTLLPPAGGDAAGEGDPPHCA